MDLFILRSGRLALPMHFGGFGDGGIISFLEEVMIYLWILAHSFACKLMKLRHVIMRLSAMVCLTQECIVKFWSGGCLLPKIGMCLILMELRRVLLV